MTNQNKKSKYYPQRSKYSSIIRTRSQQHSTPQNRTPFKDRTSQENTTDDDEILLTPSPVKSHATTGSKRSRQTATEQEGDLTNLPSYYSPSHSPPTKRPRSNSPPHTPTRSVGGVFSPSSLGQHPPPVVPTPFEDQVIPIGPEAILTPNSSDSQSKPKVRFASSAPSPRPNPSTNVRPLTPKHASYTGLDHLTRRFSCLSPLTPLPAGGLGRQFMDDDDEDEILLSPSKTLGQEIDPEFTPTSSSSALKLNAVENVICGSPSAPVAALNSKTLAANEDRPRMSKESNSTPVICKVIHEENPAQPLGHTNGCSWPTQMMPNTVSVTDHNPFLIAATPKHIADRLGLGKAPLSPLTPIPPTPAVRGVELKLGGIFSRPLLFPPPPSPRKHNPITSPIKLQGNSPLKTRIPAPVPTTLPNKSALEGSKQAFKKPRSPARVRLRARVGAAARNKPATKLTRLQQASTGTSTIAQKRMLNAKGLGVTSPIKPRAAAPPSAFKPVSTTGKVQMTPGSGGRGALDGLGKALERLSLPRPNRPSSSLGHVETPAIFPAPVKRSETSLGFTPDAETPAIEKLKDGLQKPGINTAAATKPNVPSSIRVAEATRQLSLTLAQRQTQASAARIVSDRPIRQARIVSDQARLIRGNARQTASLEVLKSCVLYVDVATEDGTEAGEAFVEMLKGLGARILSKPSRLCTHIVFKNGSDRTITQWRSLPEPRPKVVGVGWVVECTEKREKMNENNHLVDFGKLAAVCGNAKRRQSEAVSPLRATQKLPEEKYGGSLEIMTSTTDMT